MFLWKIITNQYIIKMILSSSIYEVMNLQQRVKVTAIVVAAGKGKRMGANYNKQFIKLNNKPIVAHTLEKLENNNKIHNVILVVGEQEVEFCIDTIIKRYNLEKVSHVIAGGAERSDSVCKGLQRLEPDCDIVLVQDGARPFISQEIIDNSIEAALLEGAAIVGVPVKDTIKQVNDNMEVVNTLKRSNLWAIQTPQVFKREIIIEAYNRMEEIGIGATDDASLVEGLGMKVKILMGSYDNIKITTPEDLLLAEEILKKGGL